MSVEKGIVSETEKELESMAGFAWQALIVDASVSAVLFAELVARVPAHPDYWTGYGMALAKTNQTGQAISAFERHLELRPKNIEAWCVLAELSMDQLDWTRAARALEKCLQLDPQSKHPSGARARALIKKGEKLLAQALEKA